MSEQVYGSKHSIGPRQCGLIVKIAEAQFAGENLTAATIRAEPRNRYSFAALLARGLLTTGAVPVLTKRGKAIAADLLDIVVPAGNNCAIVHCAAPLRKE